MHDLDLRFFAIYCAKFGNFFFLKGKESSVFLPNAMSVLFVTYYLTLLCQIFKSIVKNKHFLLFVVYLQVFHPGHSAALSHQPLSALICHSIIVRFKKPGDQKQACKNKSVSAEH